MWPRLIQFEPNKTRQSRSGAGERERLANPRLESSFLNVRLCRKVAVVMIGVASGLMSFGGKWIWTMLIFLDWRIEQLLGNRRVELATEAMRTGVE